MTEVIKMNKLLYFLKKNLNSILFFISIHAIYFIVCYLNNVDIRVFIQGFEICLIVFFIYLVIKYFDFQKELSNDEKIEELEKQIENMRNDYISWQKDIQEYFSMWVHQIKTPITCLEILTEDNKEMKMQLKSIDNYTNMAINYLKLNLHEKDMDISAVDVDNLLNMLIKKYSLLFINSHISLDFRKNGLKCITDSKWLSVLLEQILSNAIKYSENSQIILDSFKKDNSVVILIEDHGIGIPEEDINRIFDKGYSGFNGRLKQKSSGLGLYLAKSIADKLDIRLKVDSTVGQGSKFYVIVNN
ncbi:ATPase/histidine kinase/DNA gyrase B/HSP90 domain protein [Finegoldia magna SY403409CC001050417]|uniref:histidine kinase n=2 Tax=Finegoldia magna TaxID=1260 RepID=A0A7D4G194_FINMA|nr:ATPase/histidine kinase/DNA gyrase B/HSP90 domain protein [Finegoldia magna SY403409CC001050417]QKH80290.1 sensor histidine kinase [Finegoldia magna]